MQEAEQLLRYIRQQMHLQRWLPPRARLAAAAGIAPETLDAALRHLEREGYLEVAVDDGEQFLIVMLDPVYAKRP